MRNRRSDVLSKRLDSYWRMERGCAVIFPPLGFAVATPRDLLAGAILALALVACCAILLVGAAYWRAVWHMVRGDRLPMRAALGMAARWQTPCRVAAIMGMAASTAQLVLLDAGRAAIAAFAFSVLAGLEYVNYYIVQLQNFDHLPTFGTFLRRRRFPRSHLARDLDRWSRPGHASAADAPDRTSSRIP